MKMGARVVNNSREEVVESKELEEFNVGFVMDEGQASSTDNFL